MAMPIKSSTGTATRSKRSGLSVVVCKAAPLSRNWLLIVGHFVVVFFGVPQVTRPSAVRDPTAHDWLVVLNFEVHGVPCRHANASSFLVFRNCEIGLLTCVKLRKIKRYEARKRFSLLHRGHCLSPRTLGRMSNLISSTRRVWLTRSCHAREDRSGAKLIQPRSRGRLEAYSASH